MRWLSGILLAAVLSGFAFFLITGDFLGEGPILVNLGDGHGVHKGDLFVVGGWLIGMLAAGFLVAASPARSHSPERVPPR